MRVYCGVGENDQNLGFLVFIGYKKGLEINGHRIGLALTIFNTLKIENRCF